MHRVNNDNMKRASSATREPSPAPPAYSGTSNYRTDSYHSSPREKPDSSISQTPTSELCTNVRIHFEEFSKYLAPYLARSPPQPQLSARQKIIRLTEPQLQELSTDMYDELIRRKNNTSQDEVPFLPARDDVHPKRNQARQKLATLPISRFEGLSSEVYHELVRRYPEFKEDGGPSSTSDSVPPAYSP